MSDTEAVLGIDFGGTKIALALATADGRIVSHDVVPTEPEHGAAQALERSLTRCRELVELSDHRLSAVGAVSPGIVQAEEVLLAPNVPGWESVALAEEVRKALPVDHLPAERIVTGTDAKAAALAESRHGGLRASQVGLFVNLGTGLAVAAVVDGVVLAGAHSAAGEIGYQLVRPGQAAFADGHAPLEEQVSGRVLAERASTLAGRPMSGVAALRSTEPAVVAAVDEALDALELAIVNLCCTVDPDTIVLGGGLAAAADVLCPRLQQAVDRAVPFAPDVRVADFPQDAPLLGALTLALDCVDGPGWTLQPELLFPTSRK